MTDKDLEEFLENYLSAFFKICPVCDAKFKDTLDVMIFCKERLNTSEEIW